MHKLLRDMLLARIFEERVAEEYTKGEIAGFLHLYPGEEAVGAGVINAASQSDYIVSAYREHAHALIRGVPPRQVMAELFGRVDGMCGGMGGSMHMFDRARRFMGGYAIVGETYPIAIGVAYAVAMRKQSDAVICFFGDGASNQGTFHESLNMAALWRLPVLFVCENNHYAIGTEIHRHASVPELYKRASAYGIPASRVDGMDVTKVYAASQAALDQIRHGTGPQFLEFETYRYRGHSMADPGTYRPAVEVKAYEALDPIHSAERELKFAYPSETELDELGLDNVGRLTQQMIDAGHLEEAEITRIRQEVQAVVADATDFAAASAQPTLEQAWQALNGNRQSETLI